MPADLPGPRRPRRLRRSDPIRNAVADVNLTPASLILPLFVGDLPAARPVSSMPDVQQMPVELAAETVERMIERGLRQFIFFGVTPADRKDATGSYAADPEAPVNRVLRLLRQRRVDAVLYADLCFCEYTSHGHCGPLAPGGESHGNVDNDRTLALLGRTAIAQAEAGADVVAPSGMMDGQVGAIRAALDAAGQTDTAILSYSVKYASSLYGPFREAGEGQIAGGGDRKGYQMDYRRSREWRTELGLDLAEGADLVMVKPALAYLDVIHQVRQACSVPVVAYHVSGEYAMLHAAAQRGWLDLRSAALEHTYAIRRAGADSIITYFAPRLAEWLA